MPNFDVRDAYGSVITIESSLIGSANRQVITAALGNSSVVLLGGANVIGSVVALQGTTPWVIGSVSGTVNIAGNPSISGTVNIGTIPGSVIAFQGGTWTPSISGTVGASILGQLPAGTAVLGSVATLQGTNPWTTTFSNSSILATQQGTVIASVINSTPSSLLTGASIFGQLPAGTAVLGSVAVLQGTALWNIAGSVAATITNTNINVSGSVLSQIGRA